MRNPYKRVVSMFTNKYCGGKGHSQLPEKFILSKVTLRMFVLKLSELKKENKLNKIDNHTEEQSNNYISNKNSYIVKLEEFDEKIIKVYKQLNLDVLIPKIESFLRSNKVLNKTKKIKKKNIFMIKSLVLTRKYFQITNIFIIKN